MSPVGGRWAVVMGSHSCAWLPHLGHSQNPRPVHLIIIINPHPRTLFARLLSIRLPPTFIPAPNPPTCVRPYPTSLRTNVAERLSHTAPKKRVAEDDGAGPTTRSAKAPKTDSSPKAGRGGRAKKGPKVRLERSCIHIQFLTQQPSSDRQTSPGRSSRRVRSLSTSTSPTPRLCLPTTRA